MTSLVPNQPAPPALTPVQAQVVLALARGATITGAAEALGLHRATIYNWLKAHAEFEQAVEQARAEYILTLQHELKELSGLALATLRSLLEKADVPHAVRLRTALAILERPQFPQTNWNLPEPVGSPEEEQLRLGLAVMEFDDKRLRLEEAADREAAILSGDEVE